MKPEGVDRKTALKVRNDILHGRRVDDQTFRPVVEFYVRRITKACDMQDKIRVLYVIAAVSFIVAFSIGLFSSESRWQVAFSGVDAVFFTGMATIGPRLVRNRRRRLDINRD